MSQCVLGSWSYIKILSRSSAKLNKQIIKDCDEKLLNALTEVFYNVANSNVILTQTARNQLKKKRKSLTLLGRSCKSIQRKRNKILKHGVPLFPIVLPSILAQINIHGETNSDGEKSQ
jgi:hypothetical protein